MQDAELRLREVVEGRYRIERELGRGGMAVVYLAEDLKHGRRVAIKLLDPALGRAVGADRFLREIEIAAKLTHPRIVPLLDSGSAAGLVYYVMPYVSGESLRARLEREGQLPVEEALEITRQIAGALAYAHGHGIVHRDVKPENILLSGGEAVVTDFGIAHAVTVAGGQKLTETGFVVGTPAYMSPEQSSDDGATDVRSDIYSLACVLYEMLAGEPPFAARTAQAVAARKLVETAPNVRALRDTVPVAVAGVVRKALARLPADRYRTAESFAEALRRSEQERAGELAPAAPDRHAARWRMTALGLVAALLAVLTANLTGWPGAWRGQPSSLFVEFALEGSADLGPEVVLAPDGRHVAYVNGDRLWIRELGGIAPRVLPGSDGARMPFWSPDGSALGYAARGQLWRAPTAGGEAVPIATLSSGLARGAGATWTSDGDIVYATGSTSLMSVSARGGTPRVLVPLEEREQDHHTPHALPGGRGLLFVPHTFDGTNSIVLVAGGERRVLLRLEGSTISHPVYSRDDHILFATESGIMALPFSLRRMEATGEPFVVQSSATMPSLSAGGALAFHRGERQPDRQLAFVHRDGRVDRLVGQPAEITFFSVSPVSRDIALSLGNPPGIWVVDPVHGTRRRLTADGEDGDMARWSPDGGRVAYFGAPGGTAQATSNADLLVRLRAADGTGAPRDLERAWYPTFTADGEHLVMTLGLPLDDDEWDIGYVSLGAEGGVTRVVASAARECCQDVSPDGHFMAYASDVSGRWEVYVTRFPSGEGVWQVSNAGGSWPRWDRSGGRLYFAQNTDIMEARVATMPRLEIAPPMLLFSRPARVQNIRYGLPDYFDVSPDGDGFLVVLPAPETDSGAGSAVVIGNWRAALRR